MSVFPTEREEVHEIADGRTIDADVGIVVARSRDRIRQIVAAAPRHRRQVPVLLDEFQQRDVIVIGVIDIALSSHTGDTAMKGIRVPSPKKSTGWM